MPTHNIPTANLPITPPSPTPDGDSDGYHRSKRDDDGDARPHPRDPRHPDGHGDGNCNGDRPAAFAGTLTSSVMVISHGDQAARVSSLPGPDASLMFPVPSVFIT